jgi:hypothetical protein
VLDDGVSLQNQNPIRYPDGSLDSRCPWGYSSKTWSGKFQQRKRSGDENYRILPTIDPVNTVNTAQTYLLL